MRRHPHSRRRENGIDKREQSKAHEQVLYHLRRRSRARNVASEMTSAPRCLRPAHPSWSPCPLVPAVPETEGSEGGCLDGGRVGLPTHRPKSLAVSWDFRVKWSGRRDSDPGPPAPKAGALPGCATPRQLAGKRGCVLDDDRLRRCSTVGRYPLRPSIPTRGQFSGSKSGRPFDVPIIPTSWDTRTENRTKTLLACRLRNPRRSSRSLQGRLGLDRWLF